MIVIFIALIILYLGVILFVWTTFVKISLFAMDKLAVFIASWYYTHHYFSIKFSSGYAVYFWDILAAIVAVVLYSVLFKLIHDKLFESNVIYIGTKTFSYIHNILLWFESNVIYIGTKTKRYFFCITPLFESNVIYIGTKKFSKVKLTFS